MLLTLVALGATAAACVDVTPITDVPSSSDAGADVFSPSVTASACFQCSSGEAEGGPSCGTEYAACNGDPRCLSMFMCGIPRGCYRPGRDLVQCLTACGAAAGLTGLDDPAVPAFLALYSCATSTCSAACGAADPLDAAVAKPTCAAPLGATCPPTSGNCKGIGAPCTRGGEECNAIHAICDRDLDPRGVGICVTVLTCTGGDDCGSGATCCKTATTQNVPICMPNQCLPADCAAEL